jgi:uncharacterized membrane protein YkvA (DUF1232 family)
MGDMRERWLENIRGRLREANEKSAERAADLAVSFSERAKEEDARDLMKGFMAFAEFLPSVVLLAINLTLDKRVPIGDKIKIGVLAAYLALPADVFLMQFVGPLALMDDVVVIAYLIFSICALIGNLDPEVLRDNWVGTPDQVEHLAEAARAIAGLSGARQTAVQVI